MGSLFDSHGDVLVTKVRTGGVGPTAAAYRPASISVVRTHPTPVPEHSSHTGARKIWPTQVHKANSLEHLKVERFSRRPGSAASSRSYTSTGAKVPRPQSAMSRPSSRMSQVSMLTSTDIVSRKSVIQKIIDGDTGPQMIGVTTYPYTRLQREYLDDFQSLCATTIEHPYMATTAFNCSSVPHDLLYGSNFDDDRLGGIQRKWRSEQRRSFPEKSLIASKRTVPTGVRSEQVQFLG